MRVAALALLSLILLAGCRSGPAASWELVEWGDAREAVKAAAVLSVAPLELPAEPAGGDEVRPTNWREAWPGDGAALLAKGVQDADGKLQGRAGADGDVRVRFVVSELYNGDGGGHYMGANPEAFMSGLATVTARDGRVVAVLRGSARQVGYSGSGAFDAMCFNLGEELKSWANAQR